MKAEKQEIFNPARLAPLATLPGYRRLFMDVAFWAPYVRLVCRRHDGPAQAEVRGGLPGTYPTFIVGDRWVIKFFGVLFEGALTFERELAVNQLLTQEGTFPAPRLLGWGKLFEDTEDWPWPYLIFEFVPGRSLGEENEGVPFEQKLELAPQLARIVRRLHELPMPPSLGSAATYREFLRKQRARCAESHREWGRLPRGLLEALEDFLPSAEALLPNQASVHLIHADLTQDHILGTWRGDRWQMGALIDFGDAMAGDLYYELIALHLDLFRTDKRLLRAFLEAYGVDAAFYATLPTRAMVVTLLHRFNVLEGVPDVLLRRSTTLDELARRIWEIP